MSLEKRVIAIVATSALLITGATLPTRAATRATRAPRAAAMVASPIVEGPVTGGKGAAANAAVFDIASVGYRQAEYFIAGTATAYTSAQPLTSDGKWTASAATTTAPYKTRILVSRPIDAKKFNGTVYVEWHNVSAGGEATPDWALAHNEIIREGAAWVGVSVQATGVVGGTSALSAILQPLVRIDPERYGTLVHPGDSYSYDIFSQAGQAVRSPVGVNPLGKLEPQRVIAVGESQSAIRLTTYIDAVQPLVHEFDGFLVHSRSGSAAALSQAPLAAITAPTPTFIRADLDVPVMVLITETDLVTLGYRAARQPDTKRLRVWEMAGTSHADSATLSGATDDGNGAGDLAIFNSMATPPPVPVLGCAPAINAGQQVYVVRAAVHNLDAWVRRGTAPPKSPRIETDDATGAFVLDGFGNVRGGIRTPAVDVPVATLSGLASNANGALCRLFGVTTPFDTATLATLYPTHTTFVTAWNTAVDAAVKAGFVLAVDAVNIKKAAAQSKIGGAS